MQTRLSPFSRQQMLAAALALISVSCGDDSSSPEADAGGSDAGHATAGDSGSDAGHAPAGDSGSVVIPTFNGCTAADYLDKSGDGSPTIEILDSTLMYKPKCITIAKGQSVTWTGDLSVHPLAPGNANQHDAGTLPSPIARKSGGTSVKYAFPNAGVYPYYCENHGYGDGEGMSASIYVK